MTTSRAARTGAPRRRVVGGALALALGATGAAACGPSPEPGYRIVRLAVPDGVTGVTITEVHEDGRIVGHHPADGPGYRFTALVWDGPADPEPEAIGPVEGYPGFVSNERGDRGAVTGTAPTRSTLWLEGAAGPVQVDGMVVDLDEQGRALLRLDTGGSAIWDDGNVTPVVSPAPDGWDDAAFALTDAGLVLGSSTGPNWEGLSWLWRDGTAAELAGLGDAGARGRDINEAGRIVGSAPTDAGWVAVRWEGGGPAVEIEVPAGLTDTSGEVVNEAGDVIGSGFLGQDQRAWSWSDGSAELLPTNGGASASARAVNEAGQVVGTSATGQLLVTHAALWEDGEVTNLGTLGGRESYAVDITDSGLVVGTAAGTDQVQVPVAWLPPEG